MRRMPAKYWILLSGFFLLFSHSAIAGLSKCKQADGSYLFSDTGCKGTKLIKRTELKKQGAYQVVPPASTYTQRPQGCTTDDRRIANAHFGMAERISHERGGSYDFRKQRKRRHKHEMTVAQAILAACSKPRPCSIKDRDEAMAHFDKAKQINDLTYREYDDRVNKNRNYDREITIAKSILASC